MARPAKVHIDITALQNNLQQVKLHAKKQQIMAVVKANAYGHGAVNIAQALEEKVDALAVSCLEEALILRAANITKPIVLLEGIFEPDELPIITQYDLQIVLHNTKQIEYIAHTQLKKPISIWLKVDTGMHRLGFSPSEIGHVYKVLQRSKYIAKPIRLMSHLACADDCNNNITLQQSRIFLDLAKRLGLEASLANSAGILGWHQTHADWVRPGIMLYGISPFINGVAEQEHLKPVMQLESNLINIKQYQRGQAIGYGATWHCPQPMPVGVIAIGYADGYPRHAPSGMPVLVNNKRVPLIGRVSMDMITVDLRSQPNARIGDPVILWGNNLPVEEVAALAGTIAYELLCNVNQRVRLV
ncbi:MAG: alanine racemase [Thiomargarita sp.]|nr:alanine racemase [Thiomargarita sp.]